MNETTPLVVANFKANKNWQKIIDWLNQVGPKLAELRSQIVLCPSYPFLVSAYELVQKNNWNIKLGSQDISIFQQGAYTGEVASSQINDICEYAIIGHSERRQNFKEDQKVLELKIKNSQISKIEPIYCIQTQDDQIPQGINLIAYEPVFAIGTGNPDTAENVKIVTQDIKQKGEYLVLYGGSISADNAKQYLTISKVDGLLIGATNSLDPLKFIKLLENIQ